MTELDKSPDEMSVGELRKLVSQLNSNFRRAVWIGTVTVAVVSALGYGKLTDIESSARDRVDAAISKNSDYFDLLINGQSRLQASQWNAAIPYFEAARALRPDDEYVLYSLLQCYASAAELDAGLRLIEDVEKSGLFSRKFNQTWTLLNAGRIFMLAGVNKPELISKAEYYLGRAHRSAEIQKGGELAYVLYADAILDYVKGNKDAWARNLTNLASIDPRARDWPAGDRPDPWFQLLLHKFPTLAEDFERTLRGG